jgi:catechol 2,3-dioxygenase-like lactoylglutathione lyase family enzyme
MTTQLDHIILNVNDVKKSVAFYVDILGFADASEREPFSIVRVSPSFVIQLGPWGTKGGEHLAFATSKREYGEICERVRAADLPFGDRFDAVGNMKADGEEKCAQGVGRGIYFFDPNEHLIEIRHYEG